MSLTPLDVDNYRLRGALRGYDKNDVDQLRAEVIATIEEHIDLIGRQKLRIRELENELARYREQDEQFKNSLLFAQRSADEHVAAARERAAALVEQARGEAAQLRRGLADLAAQREQFEYEFHGLLMGFLRRIEQRNPALAGSTGAGNGRVPAAPQQVVQSMDTQGSNLPEPDNVDHDIQLDMEDLTVEPLGQVTPAVEPGDDAVVLPMAQPLGNAPQEAAPPSYTTRVDSDNASFSAALDYAASRPEVLAEPQRPISGGNVHEQAEQGGDATETLQEIVDEEIRQRDRAELPINEAEDEL
jgi:DivIVA domain-containing protein